MPQPLTPQRRRDLLNRGFSLLETLRYCREKTGLHDLGRQSEMLVVDAMLRDLYVCTMLQEVDEELRGNKTP